jgi:hypothetical protein
MSNQKQFPETLYITFQEESSFDDGGFYNVETEPQNCLVPGEPTTIGVYILDHTTVGTLEPVFEDGTRV